MVHKPASTFILMTNQLKFRLNYLTLTTQTAQHIYKKCSWECVQWSYDVEET